jgi:sporulation-control protein spo0M
MLPTLPVFVLGGTGVQQIQKENLVRCCKYNSDVQNEANHAVGSLVSC